MMVSLKPIALLFAIILWLPFSFYFTIFHDSFPAFTTTSTTTVGDSSMNFSFGSPLEDDPDDVDLLNRASQADPYPTQPGKKVAFFFLTHTPLYLAPLWELFFNQSGACGKYNVYIHADPTFKYDNQPFTGVFSGRVIPSKPTRRNSPTLIAAARRLLAYALVDDPANYMFTLLSAACIPLHSFSFTYHTLVGSTDSFIEILAHERTAKRRWAARGTYAMLPEVRLESFRTGSQFWSLTRRHALEVVEDVKVWSKFRLPCIKKCFPEESYFPTLLSMVDPRGVVPATLTSVYWQRVTDKEGHPYTYDGSEVGPELIQRLRKRRPRYGDWGINDSDLFLKGRRDPFLFARKFAPNCLRPLMTLADHVLFND